MSCPRHHLRTSPIDYLATGQSWLLSTRRKHHSRSSHALASRHTLHSSSSRGSPRAACMPLMPLELRASPAPVSVLRCSAVVIAHPRPCRARLGNIPCPGPSRTRTAGGARTTSCPPPPPGCRVPSTHTRTTTSLPPHRRAPRCCPFQRPRTTASRCFTTRYRPTTIQVFFQ